MKKTIGVLIGGALAAGALIGAGAAQAAPFELIDNPSPHIKPVKDANGNVVLGPDGKPIMKNHNPGPWDLTDDIIKLPIGNIKFTGADSWGQNYGGAMGPKEHENKITGNTSVKRAGNPSE